MKNRIHEKITLQNYSKDRLIEHIMCLEHNIGTLEESFENQYKNCMQMIDDMNLLNDTYKKAKERTIPNE